MKSGLLLITVMAVVAGCASVQQNTIPPSQPDECPPGKKCHWVYEGFVDPTIWAQAEATAGVIGGVSGTGVTGRAGVKMVVRVNDITKLEAAVGGGGVQGTRGGWNYSYLGLFARRHLDARWSAGVGWRGELGFSPFDWPWLASSGVATATYQPSIPALDGWRFVPELSLGRAVVRPPLEGGGRGREKGWQYGLGLGLQYEF